MGSGWHLHHWLAWLLEHALPLDLRHLHIVPVLIVASPHVPLVAVLLLLLSLDGSVDWLLERWPAVHWSAPLHVVPLADLSHDHSERSNQGDEVLVLGAENVHLVLLVSLLVHLLLEVEPSLLLGLTEVGVEVTAFEETIIGCLLGSAS